MERYDIIIIGTGPAGVSAAITATIRNKKILLIGSKLLSNKIAQGHKIENYPGLPSIAGADFAKALQAHLDKLGIEIYEERVSAVYSMGDYFTVQAGADMIEATSVILATGVVAGKPIPGETELVGRGVSYCATCDAPLYRGKDVIVIGYSPKEEEEARFLSEVTNSVTYFKIYKDEADLPDNIKIVDIKPAEIKHLENRNAVIDADGQSYEADGIFVLRDAISPGQLVPGLKTDGAHIIVDRTMATSIAGCFACGDITGTPYQYVKSAGEGNVAALSAVSYIDKKRAEK